jgi:hypothetical protein
MLEGIERGLSVKDLAAALYDYRTQVYGSLLIICTN